MKKVTLTNDFHNSEVDVLVNFKDSKATLSPYQTKRVNRELCGVEDCRCGGARGPQGDLEVQTEWNHAQECAIYVIFDHQIGW